MARGVNKVILVGNVGIDPEIRYMPNGSPVANFSLATSETWKDKTTGEKQERTEWHRVVCFNRLAEIVSEYVKKGSKLYVEGSLRTRKWQDQQGIEKYTTEIMAAELQMLDAKDGRSSYAPAYDDVPQAQGYAPSNASDSRSKQPTEAATQDVFEQLDDDVPF